MYINKVEIGQIGLLNSTMQSFVEKSESLKNFSNYFSKENVLKTIEQYDFNNDKREVLFKRLEKQYSTVKCELPETAELILNENTFTVTTGHQLNFLTGPSYSIYKIASVVSLAKQLKIDHPSYNFVPVFWLATEDHDFEEVSSVSVFNNDFSWDSKEKGAVGRMACKNQNEILISFFEKLGLKSDLEHKLKEVLIAPNLSHQYIQLIHFLFTDFPELIVLDADCSELKAQFSETIKDELINRKSFELINQSSKNLELNGFKTQINPREINLFYLKNGLRERIVFDENVFKVNNTDITFTLEEIKDELDKFPEKFSPNVALRPVYQQCILPNLAYIGGAGELTYWHQLKSTFQHYKTPFPVLCLRDSFVFINEKQLTRWQSFDLNTTELFSNADAVIKAFLARNTEALEFKDEEMQFNDLFKSLLAKAEQLDQSLTQSISADKVKLKKSLDGIISRFDRTKKRKHDVSVSQIKKILQTVSPQGTLQERVNSIWNVYVKNPIIVNSIVELSDCTANEVKVVTI